MRNAIAALAVAALAFSASAAEPAKAAPEVLVLGVFHFDNPGLDFVKSEVPDVLAPERQKEIATIVDQLAAFKPTKIVVEWPADKAAELERRYADYRAGKYELTRSETYQLAFRLAKALDLPTLYAGDVKGDMDFDSVIAYAQKNDPAFMASFGSFITGPLAKQMQLQKEAPIAQTLLYMNAAEFLTVGHSKYVEMSRLGGPGNYIGAEVVGVWYVRNLKIFSNIARLAQPGERLLVLFGGGHAPLLREYAAQYGMRVRDVGEFLK
jgi:hypothetical protein